MKKQQDRQDEDDLWRSYMALTVKLWAGKETPTFEDLLEKQRSRSHVTTREEIEAAEAIGRETAAAFGLL